jgi:tRNA A-37 threonylcarbamoyl transferase component Bud32
MEVAPGKPLWSQYKRGEEEPVMTTVQAAKVAAALHDLHRLGFAHGDLHPLQLICDGDDVKMVDFGLSVRHEDSPVKAVHDLNKIGALVRWDNEELQSIPYVRLVMKYLPQYRAVAGRSQAAIAQREEIAKLYLKELEEL